jgi:hypothetical protein
VKRFDTYSASGSARVRPGSRATVESGRDHRDRIVIRQERRVNAPAPRTFVGVDGCKLGWVTIALDDSGFVAARHFPTFDALLLASSPTDVIAVDMPIGLVDSPSRAADQASREFLQSARASVFNPPRARSSPPPPTTKPRPSRSPSAASPSPRSRSISSRRSARSTSTPTTRASSRSIRKSASAS